MPRVKWVCPGCKTKFTVNDPTDLVVCPNCKADPELKQIKKRKKSGWSPSDLAFVGIMALALLAGSAVAAHWLWKAVPKADPDQLLVKAWLKDNLDDPNWELVKFYPPQTLQGLYELNLVHAIDSMEKEKSAYEKGMGKEENKTECQMLYDKIRDRGLRTFCAMKFRVATLNGVGRALRHQVFEIVDGKAVPCPNNDIVELQSSPFNRAGHPVRITYDGWRFFEDREYDPFVVDASQNIDARWQSAMTWNAEAAQIAAAAIAESKKPVPQAPPPVILKPEPEVVLPPVIPPQFRDYFDREAEMVRSEVQKLEKRISTFRDKIKSSRNVSQNITFKDRIQGIENEIGYVKRTGCTASIPEKPDVGDVGLMQTIEVTEVVNETTLVIAWFPNGKVRVPKLNVAIHPIETDGFKVGDRSLITEFFKVTSTKADPTDVLKKLPEVRMRTEFIAEPSSKGDVEKWRSQYEKESKKAK